MHDELQARRERESVREREREWGTIDDILTVISFRIFKIHAWWSSEKWESGKGKKGKKGKRLIEYANEENCRIQTSQCGDSWERSGGAAHDNAIYIHIETSKPRETTISTYLLCCVKHATKYVEHSLTGVRSLYHTYYQHYIVKWVNCLVLFVFNPCHFILKKIPTLLPWLSRHWIASKQICDEFKALCWYKNQTIEFFGFTKELSVAVPISHRTCHDLIMALA